MVSECPVFHIVHLDYDGHNHVHCNMEAPSARLCWDSTAIVAHTTSPLTWDEAEALLNHRFINGRSVG